MSVRSWSCSVAGVVFVLSCAAPLGAQGPATGAKPAAKGAQAPAKGTPTPAKSTRWVVPRTPDGKPDLQGNWTNETQTPLERMGAQGGTLTDEQAAAIENARAGRGRIPRSAERSESSGAAQGR